MSSAMASRTWVAWSRKASDVMTWPGDRSEAANASHSTRISSRLVVMNCDRRIASLREMAGSADTLTLRLLLRVFPRMLCAESDLGLRLQAIAGLEDPPDRAEAE